MQNSFELFGLEAVFDLDEAALDAAYRRLLAQVHPDRHVKATAADQRAAMQVSIAANEAYQTLKSPEKRAAALCALHGVDAHEKTALTAEFLMQQMAWREALEEARAARDGAALTGLAEALHTTRAKQLVQLEQQLAQADYAAGATLLQQLAFLARFEEAILDAHDAIEQ